MRKVEGSEIVDNQLQGRAPVDILVTIAAPKE